MKGPYYWFYRCPEDKSGEERIASTPISDEEAEKIRASKMPSPHFFCEDCKKEHEGYLAQSELGKL